MVSAIPTEFQEFVTFASERLQELSSRKPDPLWANDAKRLAQATGEALMTASFEVQDTHLFTDLKLVHARLLKLMGQAIAQRCRILAARQGSDMICLLYITFNALISNKCSGASCDSHTPLQNLLFPAKHEISTVKHNDVDR